MAGKDLISERLKAMNESKEELKQDKPNVVDSIASGADAEEEKPDFVKMAEVLEAQKEERKSENEGFVKDTIYIREDLYKAMQALIVKQGDKKKHVNAAYEMYLTDVYKEKQKEIEIDK